MNRTKRAGLTAVAAVTAAAIALPATGAIGASGHHHARAKTPRVKVADDFFAPTSVKVKKGNKVKFKWDRSNTDAHNVVLRKGPKKVNKKDFKSATGSIGIKFNPKFKKPGKYSFICTIHPDTMKMTVKVKR